MEARGNAEARQSTWEQVVARGSTWKLVEGSYPRINDSRVGLRVVKIGIKVRTGLISRGRKPLPGNML